MPAAVRSPAAEAHTRRKGRDAGGSEAVGHPALRRSRPLLARKGRQRSPESTAHGASDQAWRLKSPGCSALATSGHFVLVHRRAHGGAPDSAPGPPRHPGRVNRRRADSMLKMVDAAAATRPGAHAQRSGRRRSPAQASCRCPAGHPCGRVSTPSPTSATAPFPRASITPVILRHVRDTFADAEIADR